MDFLAGIRDFLAHQPDREVPAPPPLPEDLLAHIATAYASGTNDPPGPCATTESLWYLEAMVVMRIWLAPSGGPGQRSSGLRTPPRVVQFFVQWMSSQAAAAFIVTAGTLGKSPPNGADGLPLTGKDLLLFAARGAWQRHGGDLLLACQHVLARLYPDGSGVALLHEARSPLTPEDTPTFAAVSSAVALHFSAHLLLSGSRRTRTSQSEPLGLPESEREEEGDGHDHLSLRFSSVLRGVKQLSEPEMASQHAGDRFLLCCRDVLQRLLGPAAAAPELLPAPATPLESAPSVPMETKNIKVLAQIARTVLKAYNAEIDEAALSEDQERDQNWTNLRQVSEPELHPAGFVVVPEPGPLPRCIAFMEQSALLEVIHSKLSRAPFEDVWGSNPQATYQLSKLKIKWFDLRRCTCTLKPVPEASEVPPRTASAVLVLKNLRLCLLHDWSAELSTFPYWKLNGQSTVSVHDLTITVRGSLNFDDGAVVEDVIVGRPDLDIDLVCSSTFSQVLLSALLKVFRTSLQDTIQVQLKKFLTQMLRKEAKSWNTKVWKLFALVMPAKLVGQALAWVTEQIPPEGLPI
mmetsp:Transcript_81388/g.186188  ORF Transcript_81388/g.186188 Transcript_81388/m.186188 type:complete len:576 (+) Transcript_81388:1-1728(+)